MPGYCTTTPRLLGIVVLTAGLVLAEHPKVASDLDTSNPDRTIDVIVQFKHTPTAAHHQKLHRLGALHKADLHLVSADLVSLPVSAINPLADDPEVAFIAPDRPLKGMLDLTVAAVNAGVAAQLGWDG